MGGALMTLSIAESENKQRLVSTEVPHRPRRISQVPNHTSNSRSICSQVPTPEALKFKRQLSDKARTKPALEIETCKTPSSPAPPVA